MEQRDNGCSIHPDAGYDIQTRYSPCNPFPFLFLINMEEMKMTYSALHTKLFNPVESDEEIKIVLAVETALEAFFSTLAPYSEEALENVEFKLNTYENRTYIEIIFPVDEFHTSKSFADRILKLDTLVQYWKIKILYNKVFIKLSGVNM